MADDAFSAQMWYQRAWEAGWQPVYCVPKGREWVPLTGSTGSAPWPRVLPQPPAGVRYRGAVRPPSGVVLLDVDCDRPEDTGKDGWSTIAALVATLGALPATARMTARGPFQRSGRYAYRLPAGAPAPRRDPGPGVELIRVDHRFSWAPPDVHPVTGTEVVWYGADGVPLATWPHVDELTELPAAWAAHLAGSSSSSTGPSTAVEYGAAQAAEQRAWEAFCEHRPRDGGLRTALIRWARLAAGRQLAKGTPAEQVPALIWDAMTAHPAWPAADWDPGPSQAAIEFAMNSAEGEDAPAVLPPGVTGFAAAGYPHVERADPKDNGLVSGGTQSSPTTGQGRVVTSRTAASITPRKLRWLWRDELDSYVPLSALSLFAGKGDVGKSTTAWWVAAQLSLGKLPGERFGTPSDVHIYATEDEYADTIVPRLLALGAELDRIHVLYATDGTDDELPIDWQGDMPAIQADMRKHGSVLLVIDPIISTLPEGANANHESDIRPSLTRLKRMLAEIGAAGIGIAHFNKNTDGDLDNAVAGAAAWRNIPRAVVAFIRDRNKNELLFGPIKSNGSKTRTVRNYELMSATVTTIDGPDEVPVFVPGDVTDATTLASAARSTDPATSAVVPISEELIPVAEYLGREEKTAVELANATMAGDFVGFEKWDTLRKKLPKAHFSYRRLGFQQPVVWSLTRAGIAAYEIPATAPDTGWWASSEAASPFPP